jgi:hypothetical protein
LVEAGVFDYSASTALRCHAELIEGFRDPDMLTESLERFSPPTNFWKRHQAELAKSTAVIVIEYATCLRLSGDQAVTGLECANAGGKRFKVRARFVVLAVGGLETVRVLAHSGYGNHSGMLGRTYMCHVEAALGRLHLSPANRAVQFSFLRTNDGIYCRRRFTLGLQSSKNWESSTPQFACITLTSSTPVIVILCSPQCSYPRSSSSLNLQEILPWCMQLCAGSEMMWDFGSAMFAM